MIKTNVTFKRNYCINDRILKIAIISNATMVFIKVIKKIILSGFTLLLLGGCNPEMGRLPFESDIGCLRKELGSDTHPSFQIAANFCQKDDHGIPLPLNLKGAVDLQIQAEKANIAYTN